MQERVSLRSYRDLFARYLRPQSRTAFWMLCFLVANTALQLLGPPLLGQFIDLALQRAAESDLVRTAVLYLLVTLIGQALSVLAGSYGEQVAWTATNALRLDLTSHLLHLDLGFHRRRTPGELIERVDGDVTDLSRVLSTSVVDVLGSALLLLGLLVALWILNGWIGLTFSVFVVGTAVILELVRRRVVPLRVQSREGSAQLMGFLGEVLSAREDIRASRGEAHVASRLAAILRGFVRAYVRAEVRGYVVWAVALAAFGIGDGIAYGLGGAMYQAHSLTLGAVYTVIAYAAIAARPLGTIRERLQDLQGADAGVLRVQELLDKESEIKDGPHGLPPGPLGVEFQGVGFSYSDEGAPESPLPTLEGVTFRLDPGRRLGVVGRTGSGKTTLLRLVARFLDPQEGAVKVGGTDARLLRLRDLRQRVGYVTQDVEIFRASLRANLTLFDDAEDDERLAGLLRELGLGPWLGRLPNGLGTVIGAGTLSAGEAQLVACARALRGDPGMVLLDEASSRLDKGSEATFQCAVQHLLQGRTAIVVAHRLKTLERVDDILVLDGGRVAEYGERMSLAADRLSIYSRLRSHGPREVLE